MLTPASLSSLVKLRRFVMLPVVAALALLGTSSAAFGQGSLSSPLVEFLNPIPVGTTSPSQQVNFTNNQSTALTISGISVSGPFSVTASTCPISPNKLAAHSSCAISVAFVPTETGLGQGQLTITDNASNSPSKAALYGLTSTGGPTTVTPEYLAFGNVALAQQSAPVSVTLTNNTGSPITVSGATVSTGFTLTNNACSTLMPGLGCSISVTFTPTALGTVTGAMFITDSADATPIEVVVYGTGVPAVTLTPSPLAFGNAPVGTQTVLPLTVTNNQRGPLTITNGSLTGAGFAVVAAGSTCQAAPNQLAGGASCVISVGVTPTTTGSLSGTFKLTDNAGTSPQSVALSATGVPATFVSPSSVNFGNVVVNTTSALQTVTLHNILNTTLTINSIGVTNGTPFTVDPTSTCVGLSSLTSGASCTINLKVTPTATGPASATLTINDSAASSPQTVPLSVVGVPAVQLSTSSLSFGSLPINASSPYQTVTVTNNETTPLAIASLSFTGPYSLSMSPGSSTCPNPSGALAAGASCTYAIVFSPTATGAAPGSFAINAGVATTPASVSLSGTGTLATTLSASSLAFGSVVVNATSPSQTVTLSNLQLVPLHFTSITVPAPYSIVSGAGACTVGTAVPANSSCTITVKFTPTAAGAVAPSAVTIVDDAATSPSSVALTGTGIQPLTISPIPLAFGQVATLTQYSQAITVTNNMATTLSFTGGGLTGAGYSVAPGTTCGHPLATGASCTFTINFTAPTPGNYPGTLTMIDNAPGSPQTISISATAVPAVAEGGEHRMVGDVLGHRAPRPGWHAPGVAAR